VELILVLYCFDHLSFDGECKVEDDGLWVTVMDESENEVAKFKTEDVSGWAYRAVEEEDDDVDPEDVEDDE
jgi:hypothetical protein